jgi:SAM-dependent methyltransferase
MMSGSMTGEPAWCLDEEAAVAQVSRRVTAHLRGASRPRVLEAGCGRETHVDLGADAYVVGVDIDPREIHHNDRLSEAIVGDLQSCDLEADFFDLALCWDVLEHLEHPLSALSNMHAALRPGGLMLLAVPNTRSLKAVVAKRTPHGLHEWLWHRLYPRAEAAHNPFPTVLSRSMGTRSLMRYARERAMTVETVARYESAMQARLRRKLRLTGRRWRALAVAVRVLTFGTLDAVHSDTLLVLRKQGVGAS